MSSIRQAFPKALILIPFRDPLTHAGSLLRQHRNFMRMQAEDSFVGSYMTWLAHHEFGRDHRPFRFGEESASAFLSHSAERLEYWLALWCATYGWLECAAPKDAIFVCYEDLCADTAVWNRLAKLARVTTGGDETNAFRSSSAKRPDATDMDLVEQAAAIYSRLVTRARAAHE